MEFWQCRLSCTKNENLLFYTTYNLLDQVEEEQEEDLNGHLLSKTGYTYDDAGNLATVKQFREESIAISTCTYDAWNRKITSIDPLGRLKELTSSAQDIHYLYHYEGARTPP